MQTLTNQRDDTLLQNQLIKIREDTLTMKVKELTDINNTVNTHLTNLTENNKSL